MMMMMMTKMQIHFLVRVRQPTHRLQKNTIPEKLVFQNRTKALNSCLVVSFDLHQPPRSRHRVTLETTWKPATKKSRQDEEEGNCLNDREVLSRPGFTKELAPWRVFSPPDSPPEGWM